MKQVNDLSGISYTCYSDVSRAGEQFIKDHGLSFILSGSMEAYDGESKHIYKAHDIVFYRRNTLMRFVKHPADKEPFAAVSVILDQELLMDFAKRKVELQGKDHSEKNVFKLEHDELLLGYFNGLLSWFDEKVSDDLVNLKKQEAILLLMRHQPFFKDLLFDFSTPGKIDLEAFMNSNFKFNVGLPQLAFLTGRSLASFKRDFEKIYKMSPSRWVWQRRLQEAYFMISSQSMRPKDVFLEVGFESLSHFSYAFKQHFGVNPSEV